MHMGRLCQVDMLRRIKWGASTVDTKGLLHPPNLPDMVPMTPKRGSSTSETHSMHQGSTGAFTSSNGTEHSCQLEASLNLGG